MIDFINEIPVDERFEDETVEAVEAAHEAAGRGTRITAVGSLTTTEAAGSLGVTRRAVNAAIRKGKLAAVLVSTPRGPLWTVEEAEVERYATDKSKGGRPRKVK